MALPVLSKEEWLSQVKPAAVRLLCERDSQWNQFVDEWIHQTEEYNRFIEEVKQLEKKLRATTEDEERKQLTQQKKISGAKRELAYSRVGVAGNHRHLREQELRKTQLDSRDAEWSKVEAAIRDYLSLVQQWEEQVSEWQNKLDQLESERDKKLLEEGLRQGSVKMRYIVCVTMGLPGVGKTCLKFLLMGTPPPELRTSTILAEAPIRIEIREISELKLRTSGEQWIEVGNEEMLEIVAKMIILVSVKYPESPTIQVEEVDAEVSNTKALNADVCSTVPKEGSKNPLTKFIRWMKHFNRKPVNKPPEDSKLPAVIEPQHSVPVEACRTAVNAIMDRLMQIISRLRKDIEPGETLLQLTGRNLLTSDWVLFSDCGGQPEYHELLPLFVRYISAALCVLRLPDRLDQVQAIEYYSQDKRLGASRQSQLSAKDTIRCLTNTIQSFSTETEKPKIILVGTHRDVLEEKVKQDLIARGVERSSTSPQGKIEALEEKNQALCEMLEPEFSDQLVYHSKDMRQLLFPVNTLHPGRQDEVEAAAIRQAVEMSTAQEVDVPIWWYILELLLQELAKHLGRKVLSKLECLEVANLLGFEERALEAALKFFDKLNVIKYSPKVLPYVVFIDSQVPLDKVSELVRESYLLRGAESASQEASTSPVEGKLWKHFRDRGVVSLELMKKFPRHYVAGIFTASDLAKLLVEQLVFAQIPTPNWVKSQSHSASGSKPKDDGPYFVMPASMVTLSEAGLEKHRVFSTKAAALVVKFPEGSRRAGVFSCFVVHLIRHCGWDPLLDAKVPLYRNCIQFYVKQISPPCRVTVIDSHSFIEVHANICAEATVHESARILPIIKGAVFGGIIAACRALKYEQTQPEIAFICPHYVPGKNSSDASPRVMLHTASVTRGEEFWCCDINTDVSGRLENRHHIWYGKVSQSSTFHTLSDASSHLQHQSSDIRLSQYQLMVSGTQTHSSALSPVSNLPQPLQLTATGVTPHFTPSTDNASHLPHIPEYISISGMRLQSTRTSDSHATSTSSGVSEGVHIPSTATSNMSRNQFALSSTSPLSSAPQDSRLEDKPIHNPSASLVADVPLTTGAQAGPLHSKSCSHASHSSHIASTAAATPEDLYDMSKPNSTNLTMIRWRNDCGEVKKFQLKNLIVHKWRNVGDLVAPRQQLDVWAAEKGAKDCCTAVLSYWLDHPPRHYPATWESLYELLYDSELGQVAVELKSAVENAL